MTQLFNRLFVKIFLSFWLILLITVALSIGISRLVSSDNIAAPKRAMQGLTQLANRLVSHPRLLEKEQSPKKLRRHGRPYLVDEQGQIINPGLIHREMRRFIANHDQVQNPRMGFHHNFIMLGPVAIEVQGQNYLLYVERRSNKQEQDKFKMFGGSPLLLVSMAILLSLGLCFVLARHIVKPLKQVKEAANAISLGDLNTKLPKLDRGDEIGQLNSSLQRMVSGLKQAISNQQRLLSDISHELRSPLTRLNMALALHKKRQASSPEIARIERESQRLEAMIAAILSLSRMQINAEQQQLSLAELLDELINDAEFEAQQLDKTLQVNFPKELTINCYPKLLTSAIENVCRNALRYAKYQVVLDIKVQQQRLLICISDDGEGLPEDELDNIFRPFYRSGEARDRSSGGVGLGLAISESAIRQHGGQISAVNTPGSGLQVIMSLPLIF